MLKSFKNKWNYFFFFLNLSQGQKQEGDVEHLRLVQNT